MRIKFLLIGLALVLSGFTSCGGPGYVRPDPELCQPMISLTSVDGKTMVDPELSYWFCVRRSEPHNTAFHRRPKFLEYINEALPSAASADDISKLDQAEEDAEKYIKELEAKCRSRQQ